MKKIAVLAVSLFLIASIFFFIRFVFSGSEDDWICQGGQWVKHGNPSSPKPEGGCGPKIVQEAKENLEDISVCYSENGSSMNYAKAREIAVENCKDGKLLDSHICNPNSGTWWIDFTPDLPKEGCNPACVVFVDTQATEINWRCTGLINPND